MKIIQIIGAAEPLRKIITAQLPLRTAYKLSKLVSNINRELEFFAGEREKIQERYNPETDTIETKNKAQAEMQALLEFDIEWNHEPVKIEMADLGDLKLSVFELQTLEGFVDIDYPDEELAEV